MKKHWLIEKNIVAVLFLLIGAGLIVAGILTGQVQSVFNKATRICMECLGIG